MYPKVIARDNEWNRKYRFTDESTIAFLMDWKLGQAFFGCKTGENVKFYKCEQEVFEKNFQVFEEQVEHEMDPYENVHFLRYPVEGR